MINVRITCEKDTPFSGVQPCPYADIQVDAGRSLDTQIYDQLKPLGWAFNGEQQFCPHHNPDLTGKHIVLGRDYIEPVPGVRLRLRDHAIEGGGQRVHAEVLLDRNRYDVDGTESVWRAKHVSEDWPNPAAT